MAVGDLAFYYTLYLWIKISLAEDDQMGAARKGACFVFLDHNINMTPKKRREKRARGFLF